jgi:fructose 1,6-bisphosphatase
VPRYQNDYAAVNAFGEFRSSTKKYYDDDLNSPSVTSLNENFQMGKFQGQMMTVGLRQCKLKRFFGVIDLIMMIFVIGVLLLLGRLQDKEAEALDLAEQTAQDYSVVIEDPNPDMVDPDEWKVRPRTFF